MQTKYSVILGNLGNTKDRFCGGYKENPDTMTMLRQAGQIPHVEGIELVGTWDVTPDNAKEMKKTLDDLGVACVSVIPDLFADNTYWKGSYSAPEASVRQQALDYSRRMCETAHLLECPLLNIWPGQDGFDYLLATDYQAYRDHFRDAVETLATEFPDLRFALEYKPKEPRCFSMLARMADTLLMCLETGRDNVGVCIDTGHAYVAQESVGESIVLAQRAGDRLFHMHFNDNHGHWDDDMIVGTIHSTTYLETFYWLEKTGYQGWLSMDQYPFREDAAAAIGESIHWLRGYEKVVTQHFEAIEAALEKRDGVATSRLLRQALSDFSTIE